MIIHSVKQQFWIDSDTWTKAKVLEMDDKPKVSVLQDGTALSSYIA